MAERVNGRVVNYIDTNLGIMFCHDFDKRCPPITFNPWYIETPFHSICAIVKAWAFSIGGWRWTRTIQASTATTWGITEIQTNHK